MQAQSKQRHMVHLPGRGYKACCSSRFCFSLAPRLSLFLRPQHSRYGSCVCGQIRFMCALMFVAKLSDLFRLQLSASRSTSRRLNLSAPQQQSHTPVLLILSATICKPASEPLQICNQWLRCANGGSVNVPKPNHKTISRAHTGNPSKVGLMLMRPAVGHLQQTEGMTKQLS